MKRLHLKRIFVSICCLFISFNSISAGDIYVDATNGNDKANGTFNEPVKSLAQAFRIAREWRRLKLPEANNGITIHLRKGIHYLSEPLFIRPEDSGTQNSPTIVDGDGSWISGGIELKKGERKGNIYEFDAPIVGTHPLEIRQLYYARLGINRASNIQNDGTYDRIIDFDKEKREIVIPTPANIEDLKKEKQIEMHIVQRWATATLRIKNMIVEGEKTRVSFHEPESRIEFEHPWPQPVVDGENGSSAFSLNNGLCMVDEPGEWYQDLSTHKIYYCAEPFFGKKLFKKTSESADVCPEGLVAPALQTLIKIDGTLSRQVSNIIFKNVTFAHTAWLRPSHFGNVTLQGGFPIIDAYKLEVPGLPEKASLENQAWICRPGTAISVRGANNVTVSNCNFNYMASTAIDFEWGCKNSTVQNCIFESIGGTAIMVGAFPSGGFETHVPYKAANAGEICSGITIKDNLIVSATGEDWGCAAINAGYVSDINIDSNTINHCNWSGICVGWGWTALKSDMKNNRITNNIIKLFAEQLHDAGGIYTLSNQPNSVISNNIIKEYGAAPYATNDRVFYIYCDEATDGFVIENNNCTEEKFGTNQNGKNMKWRNNGKKDTLPVEAQ